MTVLRRCCTAIFMGFLGCKSTLFLGCVDTEIKSASAMPVPNADLERIFATFYPHCTKTDTLILSDAHKLAVLFMVFLFGTLYDLGMDCISSSSGAEGYHLLARAALASDPITEHTTVHGVQAFVSPVVRFCLFLVTRNELRFSVINYLVLSSLSR